MYFICNFMKPSSNYRIVLPALTLRNFAFCHSVFLFCNSQSKDRSCSKITQWTRTSYSKRKELTDLYV